MIEHTQVYLRPDVSVPWFHDTWSPEHMQYIETKYKATGKFVGSKEITEDGLILTSIFQFRDADAETEFLNDQYLQEMAVNRDIYNANHNIERLV